MPENIFESYQSDPRTGQLLLVWYLGGSDAHADFYVRTEGRLQLTASGAAFVGKNGIGKTREGDGKTPCGEMGIRRAFGLKPNPGTSLEYLDIEPTVLACDEDCEYYNMIIDTRVTGEGYGGEHMSEYSPAYDYGLETDFNDRNVYPLGSAIFIHCKSGRNYTGGCIALDEEFMRTILLLSDTSLKIHVIQA